MSDKSGGKNSLILATNASNQFLTVIYRCINCRLGIIADALYCPVTDRQKNAGSGEVTTTASTTTTTSTEFLDFIPNPLGPNKPNLIDLILSNIPRPFEDLFQ